MFSRSALSLRRLAITIGLSAVWCSTQIGFAFAWTNNPNLSAAAAVSINRISTTSTTLEMVRTRGLEKRREGATPTVGGMTLYLKAAEDGVSAGDCPFAHFVRMVLEEKGLDYELKPTTQESKPDWLIECYEGKMPALRHRKECYVESGVIADYLDFFFTEPSLKPKTEETEAVLEGFFPAVAQYLKTAEGEDSEKLSNLQNRLTTLNEHLSSKEYLDGDAFTLGDCRLTPQLYHLTTGIQGFKSGSPDIASEYPNVQAYIDRCRARPSFAKTIYLEETILWGWGNARK